MTISFYPVHDFARSGKLSRTRRSVDRTNVDPETSLAQKTIDQILAESKNFRYIDNPNVLYSDAVSVESEDPKHSPFSKSGGAIEWNHQPRVAIVGGGLSGLMTAFQLAKIGMKVEMFEAGLPPIALIKSDASKEPDPTKSGTSGKNALNFSETQVVNGAGRIRPVKLVPDDPNSTVQLGAMRFPSNSFLFWHYIHVLGVSSSSTYTDFPNVGKIPSLFTSEERIDAIWGKGNLSFSGEYADLHTRHINVFMEYHPPGSPKGTTIASVRLLVKKPDPSGDELKRLELFWNAAISSLYSVSYKEFLETSGFTDDEIKKIGYMGIGTGGFSPLFGVSVLEIMRLFIWDYSAELEVPDIGLLPEQLRKFGAMSGVAQFYSVAVKSIAYSRKEKLYSIAMVDTDDDTGPGAYGMEYDYVVLATSHVAAKKLLSSSQSKAGSGMTSSAPDPIYPYYDTRYSHFRSMIKSDLDNQGFMPAVKIFHTLNGPTSVQNEIEQPWTTLEPDQTATTYDKRVRALFGTFVYTHYTVNLGVTYMLPLAGQSLASSDVVAGLHYSWGDDAKNVRTKLLDTSPPVKFFLESKGIYEYSQAPGENHKRHYPSSLNSRLKLAVMDRFGFVSSDSNINGEPSTGIGMYFGDQGYPYTNFAIVDWEQVPYVWLGFKLDSPGRGTHLIYSYKTTTEASVDNSVWDIKKPTGGYAVNAAVKNLYFTGDSFSHYGGWVEGAFQSALATSAGIIKSACKHQFGDKWTDHVREEVFTAMITKARDPYSY